MMKFCAFCYHPSATLQKCGKCKKRHFCSRECQLKDWKEAGHKIYCGIAGEIGVDYEIREAGGGMGLGVFALRDFRENDKIMVERPIIK
eukprot:scaffold358830_cov83-Attheya_sp.AAC.1